MMDQDMRPFARGAGRGNQRGSGATADVAPLTRINNALQQRNMPPSQRDQDMRVLARKKMKAKRNRQRFQNHESRPGSPSLPPYKVNGDVAITAQIRNSLSQVEKTLRFIYSYSGNHSSKAAVTANKLRDLQTCLDHELFGVVNGPNITPVQELRVLDSICQFFEEHNEKDTKTRYAYFETIFLGREGESAPHEARIALLQKVCLLAIQYPGCEGLVSDVAVWLNRVAFAKPYARNLISMWIDEFCCYKDDNGIFDESSLNEDGLESYLKPIIDTSPGICPYFMALSMESYQWSRIPSLPLLDLISEWLTQNPKPIVAPLVTVALDHLRAPIIEAFQKLAVLASVEAYFAKSPTGSPESPKVFSKLQLGLLKFLMSVQSEAAENSSQLDQPILTEAFMEKILQTLSDKLESIPQTVGKSVSHDDTRPRRISLGPFSPPPTASSKSEVFFDQSEELSEGERLRKSIAKESLDRIGQIYSVALAANAWSGNQERIPIIGIKLGLPITDTMLGAS